VDTKIDQTKCPGITISRVSGVRKDEGERVVRVLDGYVGSANYGVHNPSLVNLSRAVVERVLYTSVDGELTPPVRPIAGAFDRLRPIRSAVLRNTCLSKVVDIEDYPSLYRDPRKRAIYERAALSLQSSGVTKRDATVKVFVKAEKVNFSAKPDPAPRAVQPRDPRFTLSLGRYLKPFEKCVMEGFTATFGYQVACKGLNAADMAKQLRENWDEFDDPVAIGIDASRFDQHVSQDALKFEHGFYNIMFKDPELAKLLRWQLTNNGVGYAAGSKLTYTVDGCRMSGDINTSLGNIIIMICMVIGYFHEAKVSARLSNNGDDCIIFCSRKDITKFDGLDAWALEFGFKLTHDAVVSDFEKIQFCQTQPVMTGDGWRMVRNPYTATSKDMVSLLSWDKELDFNRWRAAISSGGRSLTAGVPYWHHFYSKLGGVEDKTLGQNIKRVGFHYNTRGMKCAEVITDESRYSFWLAFGMLPDEQIELESLCKPIDFSARTPLMFGDVTPYHPLLKI